MSSAAAPASARTLVFVYGTLKVGFTNYKRYLAEAVANGGARLLHDTCQTSQCFQLVVRPKFLLPPTCGPVMMALTPNGAAGSQIPGEVFEVSSDVEHALDILEGVRAGLYYKEEIDVMITDATLSPRQKLRCIAYLYPASEELRRLPHVLAYGEREHAAYSPAVEVNSEILELCRRPGHGLHTTQPSALRVHCLRLLPGDDVLHALKSFVADRSMFAASVLSAVGSTAQTVLRPAGLPSPRTFEGKFEVVSLSGTLGAGGQHHLHMSLSDAECRVFGGHVLPGCLVRTTLEVVLGEVEGVEFTRPRDARTGYDELSILPVASISAQQRKRSREDPSA